MAASDDTNQAGDTPSASLERRVSSVENRLDHHIDQMARVSELQKLRTEVESLKETIEEMDSSQQPSSGYGDQYDQHVLRELGHGAVVGEMTLVNFYKAAGIKNEEKLAERVDALLNRTEFETVPDEENSRAIDVWRYTGGE